MTAQKHLKQRVRARMAKTGERYAAARRHILRDATSFDALIDTAAPDALASDAAPALPPAARAHRPGNVPATTALRVLLADAGVELSEAMLFGIAGGIGIGVFSFYYEREDIATFFLGGRHQWYDDLGYLRAALARLNLTPLIEETGGARMAEQQLRAMLASGHPCIAWVDMALLPQRAMPAAWAGGGYHLVTIYAIDDATGSALVGDLADDPVALPLADLARARARIAKQRHRLLTLTTADEATRRRDDETTTDDRRPTTDDPSPAFLTSGAGVDEGRRMKDEPLPPSSSVLRPSSNTQKERPVSRTRSLPDRSASLAPGLSVSWSLTSDLPPALAEPIWAGLRACYDGLIHAALPGMGAANARLDALGIWAERMISPKAKERWERVFRPGPNLIRGLGAIYHFVEHYGTGGGLCRPLFADFLTEAAAGLSRPDLADLAERYATLGRAWSDLADAALPDDVPLLREVKDLYARKAELQASAAPPAEIGAIWQRLEAIEAQANATPPLTESAYTALRTDLNERIAALHAGEVAAHTALGAALPN